MKFSHDIRYAASAADVHAMLTDATFREEVSRASGALRQSASVTTSGGHTVVVVDRTLPARGIPAFATRFVGEEIQVEQRETWRSPTSADVEVAIPGKPARFRGTIALVERSGETVQSVTGEVTVSIPLVGGKLESMIADLLASALRTEERVGRARLAA